MVNARGRIVALTLGALVLLATACAQGGEEEAPAPAGDQVPAVADSVIEVQVQASLDADPRLDRDDIRVEAHSVNQEVTLVGSVPSRLEMSIARANAQSVLGVKRVLIDSLVVESEMRGRESVTENVPGAAPDTASGTTP
ncbi:MAG: BON domain-containing protein [Gemmatimonadota bacterium]